MLISPAKVNLYFHVLKKRSDGYHEIASLYQAIDLVDSLIIEPARDRDRLVCSHPDVPNNGSNLILKAAQLFRKKTGRNEHFAFLLEKKIPIQAGLGGGSSNAATALWGLNRLLKTEVADEELARWGKELGADIPFFFSHGSAFCEGIGDKLTLLNPSEVKTFWIAKPPYSLSTRDVFENFCVKTISEDSLYRNDLEQSAFSLIPSLEKLKRDLFSLGFDHVLMTGSGTAFTCMGNVTNPQLPDIRFYKVSFLRRQPNSWYKLS